MDKKYEALPLFIDPNADPEEIEMDELTVDGLIEYLMIGGEITGYIDGEKAGVLNVREDYTTFFVGYNGSIIDMDIPDDEFGPDTILYKGKTLKELLEEDIFYDVEVY